MDNILDAYEGLHQFNDALFKAILYLEAIGKSGPFEQKNMEHHRSAICRVRSETNLYLVSVIQHIERQILPATIAKYSRTSLADEK
jgi:hypothetical protein